MDLEVGLEGGRDLERSGFVGLIEDLGISGGSIDRRVRTASVEVTRTRLNPDERRTFRVCADDGIRRIRGGPWFGRTAETRVQDIRKCDGRLNARSDFIRNLRAQVELPWIAILADSVELAGIGVRNGNAAAARLIVGELRMCDDARASLIKGARGRVGPRDRPGRAVRRAFPEVAGQGRLPLVVLERDVSGKNIGESAVAASPCCNPYGKKLAYVG